MFNKYDLEERTLKFAKDCIDLCNQLCNDIINIELIKQLIKSSGSVDANYREANNSITKKDFYLRIKICRKEAKESNYWLQLLLHRNKKLSNNLEVLIDESLQVTRIFSSIYANG